MKKNKIILDVCCGGRMMWFDKKNPNTLFVDIRACEKGFMRSRKNFEIKPDLIGDFRKLKLPNESFKLVVFDPPHLIRARAQGGVLAERYGRLTFSDWENDLALGFIECWRVLKNEGFLIFKWCESDKKLKDLEHLFPTKPLFGSRLGKNNKTIWLIFLKIKGRQNKIQK